MILKYNLADKNTPELTEIADVTKEDDEIIFTPVNERLKCIVVKDAINSVYLDVIERLFDNDRYDITYLKRNTFLDDDNYDSDDYVN